MPPKRAKPGAKGSSSIKGKGAARPKRSTSSKSDAPTLFSGISTFTSAGTGSNGSGGSAGTAAGFFGDHSYLRLSTRPLHILVFLLPLILFYEAAAAFHVIGAEGVEETIRARRILADFFRVFDVGGIYLPGILVFVVLLLWQILTKDPWRVRGRVLWLMLLEALVWTPPMLVLGQVLYKLMSGSIGAVPPVSAGLELLAATAQGLGVTDPGADYAARPLMARAAIAVGAGLYEEMLFRMVGIALFHLILVDLIGMGQRKGTMLAVLFAACAFAFYHDVTGSGAAASVRWADAGFYIFAGVYFGAVYVWRGFGVVVAVHAIYDLAVLVFLSRPPAP